MSRDECLKDQLRDDLQFAIMQAEKLAVLDQKASSTSKRNPMEIKNLTDVFAVFGYSADDIIDRHDQCTIFKRIRAELEDLLHDLSINDKKYDKAILLRDRLQVIKKEFIQMQEKYENRRQEQESTHFNRAIKLAKQRNGILCDRKSEETASEIEAKRQHLLRTHQIEREQLETFLQKLPEPRVKFSKLLLELKDTEGNLSRLRLFEDAKNVFHRANVIEKEERALNTRNFEVFKEQKRHLLLSKQKQQLAELEEKLVEKKYVLQRSNDGYYTREKQRMKNLYNDMNHAFTMDIHDKKIFTTDSATNPRKNHTTSSTFRGQQFLSTLQGKRLEVASLCSIHDHEGGEIPSGSVVYTE